MILGPERSTFATPASSVGRSDRGKTGLFAGGVVAPFAAVCRSMPGTTRSRTFSVSIQCFGIDRLGLPQDWGSGGVRHRCGIVSWLELLPIGGTERAIVDGAT